MRIYLIGYMGCGKSTLGRKLAQRLEMEFIDMDHYIEQRNMMSVPQIFKEEGESAFRLKEQKALQELSQIENTVIATGGGAPCFFDNIKVMNDTGTTIYLNIDSEILANRLLNSKIERPLIIGKSKEELIQFIDKMLQTRDHYYLQAKYRITDPDMALEQIVKMIEDRGEL